MKTKTTKRPKRHSTYRTVQYLTKLGFLAGNAETWIAAAGIYRDFLGAFDVVAIRPDVGALFIQATTKENLWKKRPALSNNANFIFCLKSGIECQIWSWRKVKGLSNNQQWEPRVERGLLSGRVVEFDRVSPPLPLGPDAPAE